MQMSMIFSITTAGDQANHYKVSPVGGLKGDRVPPQNFHLDDILSTSD
jgi:hypothetical protein